MITKLTSQELMEQAATTAEFYLAKALAACEKMKVAPEPKLLGDFIHCCVCDFDTAMRVQEWERRREGPV